jgi:hypothetical protein
MATTKQRITLHLGVYDTPYSVKVSTRREIVRTYKSGEVARFSMPAPGAETTYDVAQWLEARYHVMQVFYMLYNKPIGEAFVQSLEGTVESLLMGAPPAQNPFGTATNYIQDWFRRFLSEGEIERLGIPGVPTRAALNRESARLKAGKKKGGPPRPSFIDTGLYENSFVAWVGDNPPAGENPSPRPKTAPPLK